MTPKNTTKSEILCPTCGTRLNKKAEKCLVCGTDINSREKKSTSSRVVQGSRLPEITLSLPAALGLLALFISIGAVMVYFALQQTGKVVEPTATPTQTPTLTPTVTPTLVTPTATNTPLPTPTPLSYKVSTGDTCSSIAYAFGISIQSIVLLNDLPATCDTLFVGQALLIPHPTPTATALPTATLSSAEATEAACQKIEYSVQENDTLSSISANYLVPISVIKSYNGLVNDTVRSGQTIIIPLCERSATPGPSPTPTLPPPYPAPNLLLPPDGAPFTLADDAIILQWASVGTLRENEVYAVTVVDVTEGQDRKIVEYVPDTKFIVPNYFRPQDTTPHVFRWWVLTARQGGTDADGNPIWEPAGASSSQRTFTWAGVPSPTETNSNQ